MIKFAFIGEPFSDPKDNKFWALWQDFIEGVNQSSQSKQSIEAVNRSSQSKQSIEAVNRSSQSIDRSIEFS